MFSILVDIFDPSVGTVFSKEGVFQQPLAIMLIEGLECNGYRQESLL